MTLEIRDVFDHPGLATLAARIGRDGEREELEL
jgi:hypothetical protein